MFPLQATISACTSETTDHDSWNAGIPQPPQKDARRGPKLKPARPFVVLRLWCLYPGLEAPPHLATLRKRLATRGDDLAKRSGFIDGVPDRKTMRDRFKRLDAHPSLITEALLAISEAARAVVQPYLMPPPARHPHRSRTRLGTAVGRRNAMPLGSASWKMVWGMRNLMSWSHGGVVRTTFSYAICTEGRSRATSAIRYSATSTTATGLRSDGPVSRPASIRFGIAINASTRCGGSGAADAAVPTCRRPRASSCSTT